MKYTDKSIVRVFREIEEGLYTNAHFSSSNVVIISRELYDILECSHERLKEIEPDFKP